MYNLCGFFLFNRDVKLLTLKQVSAELKDETTISFGAKISYLTQLLICFHDFSCSKSLLEVVFILKTRETNSLTGHVLHSRVKRAPFECGDWSPYFLHTVKAIR